MSNEGIRVEEVKCCLLCRESGRPLHNGLRDRLFGTPGLWGFLRCAKCGLVWLNPCPASEDIGKTYANYFTHETNSPPVRLHAFRERLKRRVLATAFGYGELLPSSGWRWVGRVASLIPPLKERVGLTIMCLDGSARGRLLDVGCGNGSFLAAMRGLGWEVWGVEPDGKAARLAREQHGLPVIVGSLEEARLPGESVDAITMHHVIEHAYDPVTLLQECHRVLRAGGRLVVVTPNTESLGHKVFRGSWRGLEPPRHFYLFSLRTLRACAMRSGFQVEVLRASARSARKIWRASHMMRGQGRFSHADRSWLLWLMGWAFQVLEQGLSSLWPSAGEEIFLVATKLREIKLVRI